jgi:hypothetical protein
VPKSKFDLETLRRYAWASHEFDQRQSQCGIRVDGIRNPEGWAIVAHRTGDRDQLVDEYLANPTMFDAVKRL